MFGNNFLSKEVDFYPIVHCATRFTGYFPFFFVSLYIPLLFSTVAIANILTASPEVGPLFVGYCVGSHVNKLSVTFLFFFHDLALCCAFRFSCITLARGFVALNCHKNCAICAEFQQ